MMDIARPVLQDTELFDLAQFEVTAVTLLGYRPNYGRIVAFMCLCEAFTSSYDIDSVLTVAKRCLTNANYTQCCIHSFLYYMPILIYVCHKLGWYDCFIHYTRNV
jgi:hypothetical protein